MALSERSARLVAYAREAPDDDARWLVVADALLEESNPLGEYIAMSIRVRRGDFSGMKRMESVARAWRRKYAPWASIFAWWRIGLVLTMRDLESVFVHIDDLRAIGLPLIVQITRGSDAPDVCMFDDAFTRIAWMRKGVTIENASWGPGLDEETHHWRDVIVWRVDNRAELFARRGIAADWIAVELRGEGLYAIGAQPGAELVGRCSQPRTGEMTFEEAITAPGRRVQLSADEAKEGKRVMMIHRLSDRGVERLAWRHVPEDEHAATVADLSTREIGFAEYDFFCDFVWVTNADGIEVYDSKRKVLDASGDRAILEDGTVIGRADIVRVIAFAHADYVYRGVKAALRSGEEVPLVTEASGGAMGDPTYSRNELLCETVWASTIGRAIARWANTEFVDLI